MTNKFINRALTGAFTISMLMCSVAVQAQDYQPVPDQTATETILLDHIKVLASDEYAGRKPGTQGGQMTQDYIVRALESYGFQPGYNGEWRQPVALVGQGQATAEISIAGMTIGAPDLTAFSMPAGSTELANREIVPVSSAADVPADMSGKIAVIGDISLARTLVEPLQEAGASAVLILVDNEAMYARFSGGSGRVQWTLATDESEEEGPAVAMLGPDGSAMLKEALGDKATSYGEVAGTMTLTGMSSTQIANSANVIGMLPGTKPGSGAVIMLGHWDHVGICGDEGDEDRICNGAADNASGIAAILETARRLADGPRSQRDIYIMGTTAEEMGLLGARYFAENPPVPLDQFEAALNIDMISIAPYGKPLSVIGWQQTPLDDPIKMAAAALNREIEVGEESELYVRRQDGWALMNMGVPAVLVSSSFGDDEILEAFMSTRYHGAADQVHDDFELGGAAQDVPVYAVLMSMLANPDRYNKPKGWEFDRGE